MSIDTPFVNIYKAFALAVHLGPFGQPGLPEKAQPEFFADPAGGGIIHITILTLSMAVLLDKILFHDPEYVERVV